MSKYLLNFLFVFLILSSFSFAKDDDAKLQTKLQEEFGAIFLTRLSFYVLLLVKNLIKIGKNPIILNVKSF